MSMTHYRDHHHRHQHMTHYSTHSKTDTNYQTHSNHDSDIHTSHSQEPIKENYHPLISKQQTPLQGQHTRTTHGSETLGNTKTIQSLHQIAPTWASVLGRMGTTSEIRFKVRNKFIDISLCHLCIVGEAHNWDSVYVGCIDCYRMSLEMASILRDPPYKRQAQLHEFVEHFNSKHL